MLAAVIGLQFGIVRYRNSVVGIGLLERQGELRHVKPNEETLTPRHGQMSGHPKRRSDLCRGSSSLHTRLKALIDRSRQRCDDAHDRRHDDDFCNTFSC